MNKIQKMENVVKLFAKYMFYTDWKWENPNERVVAMLMQELDLYPFEDEDDMIKKTKVDENLYKKACSVIPTRLSSNRQNECEECIKEKEK